MHAQTPPSGGFLRPFIVVLCLLPLYVVVGSIYGQSAGMLPQLMEEDSFIRISREEATWISSMPTIGTCIAACLSGSLSDRFGRVRMCQVAYFFMVLGYAIIFGANIFLILAVGRFLIGVGLGASFSSSVHISELAPPAYRGSFVALNSLMASAGLVYMYIIGGYLPWNIASGITCLIALVGWVLTYFCYESPTWLVRKNKIDAAKKSLTRLEGSSNVEAKLKEIQEIVDSQPKSQFGIGIFAEATVWKPFLMLLVMSILQNGCGFYIVIYYTVNFMREFHSTFDALQITVLIGVVRLLAMAVTTYLLRHIGRKTIGALSGFGSAAMLLLIYGYLKFESAVPYLHENSWILIGLFLTFIMMMTLGIFPLPWNMPNEVFPIKVRGLMCGASFCSMYIVMFLSVKSYNILLDNLRLEGMILMFAVNSVLFGLFSVMVLIETHNRTLEEIEDIFAGGTRVKKDIET